MTFYASVLSAGGCAEATPYIPAISSAITQVQKLVQDRTGKDLSELPVTCEQDFVPATGTLDILCSVQVVERE